MTIMTTPAEINELHAEALAEYASNTWCVVCLQAFVTPRHQVPAGTTVCRGSAGQEYGIRTRIAEPRRRR
jgi:hypothetical protein